LWVIRGEHDGNIGGPNHVGTVHYIPDCHLARLGLHIGCGEARVSLSLTSAHIAPNDFHQGICVQQTSGDM
jgi:hypothetical protein